MSTSGRRILVIGGESYALAFAAVGARAGHHVTLVTIEDKSALRRVGADSGLRLGGIVEPGFVPLSVVKPELLGATATAADLVVVATALRVHQQVATLFARARVTACVLLVPGGVGGALAFAASVPSARFIAELPGFPFLANIDSSGSLVIRASKRGLPLGVLPVGAYEQATVLMRDLLPDPVFATSVAETSLLNTNVLIHPPLVLANWSRIEASTPFRFYRDGLSAAGARLIEAIDAERRAIGAAFGLSTPTLLELLLRFYGDQGMRGSSVAEALGSFDPFGETPGPRSTEHRYLTDDVPLGLVPLAALGRAIGVPTPAIDAVVRTLSILSGTDFERHGRSLEDMGLAHMSRGELIRQLGARQAAAAH
jgi:opine dehydrogenase